MASARDLEMLDKLADASNAGKGLRLTHTEVDDLLDTIAEMDLQREIDAILFHKVISQLTGEASSMIN